MSTLPITNVIQVTVQTAPVGVGEYNVNNVALFTGDAPIPEDYGDYGVYVSPEAVGEDFGTDTETYRQAVAFFSQNPNVLNGGGSLIIFPANEETDGKIKTFNINATGSGYAVNDILTLGGAGTLGTFKVLDVDSAGRVLEIELVTAGQNYVVASGIATTVAPSGGTGCTINVTAVSDIETLSEVLTRVKDLIFFCGIISTFGPDDDTAAEAFAAEVQALKDKIWLFPSADYADVAGVFTDIKDATLSRTRCLLYTVGDAEDARLMAAAYAGRAFSTNFDQALSTITMNLKQLATITPDSLSQSQYNALKTAGVDGYVSYNGDPRVLSTGANGGFFDQIYNLVWFLTQLEVAGFNALAQTSTKIPQTEPGVTSLKAAYRSVCEQALNNGYIAPGEWNSPETFGNLEDFYQNVRQRGYYIYSAPVAKQTKADREARKAPLIQIAIKEAGAIQQSSVVVFVNP